MISISSNHLPHEDQLAEALDWLGSHYPTEFKAMAARFPEWNPDSQDDERYPHEWQRSRFAGNVTCSACGLLPLDEDDAATSCGEFVSWLTDALEAETDDDGRPLVTWSDGEPFGTVPVPECAGGWADDWPHEGHGFNYATAPEWRTDERGYRWLILGRLLEHLEPSECDPSDAHETMARYLWRSSLATYTPRGESGELVELCNLAAIGGELLEISSDPDYMGSPDPIRVVRGASNTYAWCVPESDVVALDGAGIVDLEEWTVALADYPLADDELHSMAEAAYVEVMATDNAQDFTDCELLGTLTESQLRELWLMLWQRKADYYGATDAWFEWSELREWTLQDLAEHNSEVRADRGDRWCTPTAAGVVWLARKDGALFALPSPDQLTLGL